MKYQKTITISESKSKTNKFKVRSQYVNTLGNITFKITEKFWFDIEWIYKIKYEDGRTAVYTESQFQYLVDKHVLKKVTSEVSRKVATTGHFNDTELFSID